MPELKMLTCKTLIENIANYSLLEIMHHEVGNGLAAITGYTQLLYRATLPLDQSYNDKREIYLHAIQDREQRLNEFLTQVRSLARQPPNTKFLQTLVKTDLTSLVENIAHRISLLYKHKHIEIDLPGQAIYLKCDPIWLELALEHIFCHNLAAHSGPHPAQITLERGQNTFDHDAALVSIYIRERRSRQRTDTKENPFSTWSQTLDDRDRDLCVALCKEIIQEHGGRLWTEQGQGRVESVCASLPIAQ